MAFDQSQLFLGLYEKEIDPVQYFIDNADQIVIHDDSSVSMFYQEALPEGDNRIDPKMAKKTAGSDYSWYEMTGAFFRQDGESYTSQASTLSSTFRFPKAALALMDHTEVEKLRQLNAKIHHLHSRYSRLPARQHDYLQFEKLLLEREKLEKMNAADQLRITLVFSKIVVVFFGNTLMYSALHETKRGGRPAKEFKAGKNGFVFQYLAFQLERSDEVLKVLETGKADQLWIQIVVQDHVSNILKVITWDLKENVERGMMQLQPDRTNVIGNHVVKGMNEKLNYLYDQYRIFDLEFNIPIL